ncbi:MULTISPECIES: Fe(2+) transporter permease subunit FeoB [unclassified Photobacterium]|uniref:Fe(2+) transporter permease subunit FeoB n=1 Tax=unclassified Photobacterium TaxID=2628852 RepID=UPI000D1665C4|nr:MULTISPECIES: Fe(2+) transporter permease subunit FeoB [unclassified Photobacterium]PSV28869.1 ferrous iron transporter B [Photobacterium sp. GB-56]PSV33281.1 ferrous iron transporter B [Photobacterium sp. GB-72]PSV40760.1 ferrous iron transporter B [Photobacterium sp. GB-210]PSW75340.1 ferrous iron transporter B [Photobacterium sp. GB-50]
MQYNILTVGNPNSGKTTLFNGLTGAKQQVGNWAGVTVEKKTGRYQHNGDDFSLTDLPGIYNLDSANDANSLDEAIASRAILTTPADVIINVVDASSLERSLYMTLQLRELGRPMVVVLNKMDVLKRQRQVLDIKALEKALGCPVLALSANNMERIAEFKTKLHKMLTQGVVVNEFELDYGQDFERAVSQLAPLFKHNDKLNARAQGIRVLENDTLVINTLSDEDKTTACGLRADLLSTVDPDIQVADVRYTFLHQLCQKVRRQEGRLSNSLTDKIDRVLLNRFFGIPFFFLVMYVMFMFAINIGSAFIDFFDISFGALLVDGGHHLLDDHLPVWLVTIIANGIGGGIQTVATFIPVIACLYLFLAVLESSGYMARAAFVLDKVMQKVGLPGKAFVPLVLGFGCNVPAIMATRTLEQERERKLAAAMAPFMSCGARLPVYALFAAAFFPENGQNVVFALYLLGIVAAVMTGLILRSTLYPGSSDSFIMEMPNYELPTIRNVVIKTWQKLKRFVFGAGKTIVVVVAVLSFFNSLGTDGSFGNEDTSKSVLSKAAQVVTPVLEPIGVKADNWPATVGIITGIFAKEAVVGTLNSLYAPATDDSNEEYNLVASLKEAVESVGDNLAALSFSDPLGIEVGDLENKQAVAEEQGVNESVYGNIQAHFVSGAAAMAYLIFILLYTPCAAAMGAYVREFGQKFALFIAGWTMLMAYSFATWFYQIAHFVDHPVTSAFWISFFVLINGGIFLLLKREGKKQTNLEGLLVE